MSKLTLLVDGPNLAFRAFHSFQTYDLESGENTSITFGFFRVLESMILEFKPSSVVACWDGGKPEYRRELLPAYKANRTKEPWLEDVYKQIDTVRRTLPACGVVEVFKKGVEADDLLYHATRVIDGSCLVATTDKDLLQAVTPDGRVKVLNPSPQSKQVYDWDAVAEYLGLPAHMLLDYRILTGDTSDNIPGVPGIGEKLARDVLQHYPLAELAVLMAHMEGPWEASNRARGPLKKVKLPEIERFRRVMDLSVDRVGAVEAVEQAVARWIPFDERTFQRFLMLKGFTSLMIGYEAAYGALEAPTLQAREEEQLHVRVV